MTEAAAESPAQETAAVETAQTETAAASSSWDDLFKGEDPAKVREALDQSRKWETRAKENSKKAREFELAQQAAMTDAERAVSEAENRGRMAAASEFGQRLARERFDALAGRRNPDFDTKAALEFVDLSKFLGDDGEPDDKAITAAIGRLVPEPAAGVPSFDGGARASAPKVPDMNDFIRKAAGHA